MIREIMIEGSINFFFSCKKILDSKALLHPKHFYRQSFKATKHNKKKKKPIVGGGDQFFLMKSNKIGSTLGRNNITFFEKKKAVIFSLPLFGKKTKN